MLKEVSKTRAFVKEMEAQGRARVLEKGKDFPQMQEFNERMAEVKADYVLKDSRSEISINQKFLTT